jgi:hypothetical protein
VIGFEERGGVHFNGWAFFVGEKFPSWQQNLAKLSKYAMIIKMEN